MGIQSKKLMRGIKGIYFVTLLDTEATAWHQPHDQSQSG